MKKSTVLRTLMRVRMKRRISRRDKTKKYFSSLENLKKCTRFANSSRPNFLNLALTVNDAFGS